MKVELVLAAVLLVIGGCNAKGKDVKGGVTRDQVKKDWDQYVDDFRKDDIDEDEDDLGLEDLEKEIEGKGPQEMNGCPSGDEIEEYQASCTFAITETVARADMMATITFSEDIYGLGMKSPYQLMLPRGQRGRLGRRRGPRAAKIYRMTNRRELSPGTITVDMKIFTQSNVAPTYTCNLETCSTPTVL